MRRLVLPWRLPAAVHVLAAVAILASCPAPQALAIEDFTFIQTTDIHAPMPQSKEVLGAFRPMEKNELTAFGIQIPPPGFVVATGDLTEFGGGNGVWKDYLSYFQGWDIPLYHNLGNHDNTWHAEIKSLRGMGLGPQYSFDAHGCHFVSLMSATPQDPRPSFGEEQIVWLQKDLEKVSPGTPLFVYFHHPLEGTEFASPYDWHRVLDVLRPHNVALVLTGHYHSTGHSVKQGVDELIGGTTFGNNAGITFVSVKGGVLRAAYQPAGETAPTRKIFEKPIATRSDYPKIDVAVKPLLRLGEGNGSGLTYALEARISGAKASQATYTIDDSVSGELALTADGSGSKAAGELDTSTLLPGAHYVRVALKVGDRDFTKSASFVLDNGGRRAAWRKYLGSASKTTPTVAGGVVYIGGNDGVLRAFRAYDGEELWAAATGAEILAQPLVHGPRVYCANGNGQLRAYSLDGKEQWTFRAPDSIYSGPIMASGNIVFGCNDGTLYALDNRGELVWRNDDAEYSIESSPFVWSDKVYFGAWDQYVRCVDAKTGNLIWKELCDGSRIAAGAKRYYSAGDAFPVVCNGRVFIADRKYNLTIYDANTGERIDGMEGVAATGLSEDGQYVYLRKTNGDLVKVDSAGKPVWTVGCELNAIPTAPVERDGLVFVSSSTGKVSAVAARAGRIMWQYQASPKLFVMSSVASDGANAYITDFSGHLTAVPCK